MYTGDMTKEQFAYWLHGYMELNQDNTLSKNQVKIIRDKLASAFKKENSITLQGRDTTPSHNVFDISPIPCKIGHNDNM